MVEDLVVEKETVLETLTVEDSAMLGVLVLVLVFVMEEGQAVDPAWKEPSKLQVWEVQ